MTPEALAGVERAKDRLRRAFATASARHPDAFKPATEFRFHALVKVQTPEAKHVPILPTYRTDTQLDLVLRAVLA